VINVGIYSGPDRHVKSSTWLRDAKEVLYDQELQARNLLLRHSSVREPLLHSDVEAIAELDRVAQAILASRDGSGILAMMQVRREEYQETTGKEVIGEQIAVLGLVASLIDKDIVVVVDPYGNSRPMGW